MNANDETMTDEERQQRDVQAIIAGDIVMPWLRWLLDADGRGKFSMETIAARVVALAFLLDPAVLHGASLRQLAADLETCPMRLSRQVSAVSEQLRLGNISTNEFQREAKKAGRRFAALTRKVNRFVTAQPRVENHHP